MTKDWRAALEAAERVLADAPDNAEAHRERVWCLARCERWPDLPPACEAAGDHLPPELLLRLARAALARGRWTEALDLWRLVARSHQGRSSLREVVDAQLLCFAGLRLTGRRPEIPAEAKPLAGAVRPTLARRPRAANAAPRHIAILGSSYCGSTLLGLVLGALPGVANVGESHWLLEPRPAGTPDAFNLTRDGYEQCLFCGGNCPVVADDLRRRLADPEADFYGALAAAYGTRIVVTSDKTYHHVLRLDPALCHDAVIVFRHPMANWRSHANHTSRSSHEEQTSYFEKWSVMYTGFMDNYPNGGDKIFVDFDRFVSDPGAVASRLCRGLGLPYRPGALSYWRRAQHCIGGNIGLRRRLLAGDEGALRITRTPPAPEDEPADASQAFRHALETWDRLRRRVVQP